MAFQTLILAIAARVADKGHSARGCLGYHLVHVIVVLLKLVLLDNSHFVSVVEPVHLQCQLHTIDALRIVAHHHLLWLRELFLDVTHEGELKQISLLHEVLAKWS